MVFGKSINNHRSKMTFGTLRIKSKGLRAPHWHFNANEHGYLLQVLSDYFSFRSCSCSLKHHVYIEDVCMWKKFHNHYVKVLTGNESRITIDWCLSLVFLLEITFSNGDAWNMLFNVITCKRTTHLQLPVKCKNWGQRRLWIPESYRILCTYPSAYND